MNKGTVLGVSTITPTNRELHIFPHILLLSEHEWNPLNFHFPSSSRPFEEDISRIVGYINTQGEDFGSVGKYDNDIENKYLYDIGNLSQRFIAIVKV